ncbi:ArsR/SmtB family transcription factor [Marinibactrum halimedae]|nr:metalloregulator ArsR/SmtB family transcription factor [Marinibactrum halimedae]MCD9458337.1 metalloregulator ArsR/SmtB family transcription factor [Marinibactrum halimedae]
MNPPLISVESHSPSTEAMSIHDVGTFLKAAGDPLRLQILRILEKDSFGVLELAHVFEMKQSGMSHHLKVLLNAGFVATRKEGNSVFYRRALADDSPKGWLLRDIFRSIDLCHLESEALSRLTHIREERLSSSQAFFTQNSEKFREQQDLIASYPVYQEQVNLLLNAISTRHHAIALEIGPGEGEFLAPLSRRFHQVLALDNSKQMLEQARTFATTQSLNNIELYHGDTTVLDEALAKIGATGIDFVVANMVLHHTPSPASIFQEVSQVMNPGATWMVTELCHHDQAWARESCGDVWLGFEPDDLTHWAQSAGLSSGEGIYFALRNGFQIQIRQFIKPSTT